MHYDVKLQRFRFSVKSATPNTENKDKTQQDIPDPQTTGSNLPDRYRSLQIRYKLSFHSSNNMLMAVRSN